MLLNKHIYINNIAIILLWCRQVTVDPLALAHVSILVASCEWLVRVLRLNHLVLAKNIIKSILIQGIKRCLAQSLKNIQPTDAMKHRDQDPEQLFEDQSNNTFVYGIFNSCGLFDIVDLKNRSLIQVFKLSQIRN